MSCDTFQFISNRQDYDIRQEVCTCLFLLCKLSLTIVIGRLQITQIEHLDYKLLTKAEQNN